MKKLLPLIMLLMALGANAQTANDSMITERFKKVDHILNILREFRIQAYAQAEWQYANTSQRPDTAGIGSFAGGGFPKAANNRFMVRRGRFKLSWQHETVTKKGDTVKVGEFALQFDATEKGFNALKDLYGRVIDPWTGWLSLQGGIFLRPFGYESPAPPATHESPEFARMNQSIMPNECELGEAIIIESPRTFKPVYLRADFALVNGEGVGNTQSGASGPQTGTFQSRKDFIGRLVIGKVAQINDGLKIGVNASGSYYYGGAMQTTSKVYQVIGDTMRNIIASSAGADTNAVYKRNFGGAHVQLNFDYKIAGNFSGTTMIRGEFIMGQQTGQKGNSLMPLGTSNNQPGVNLYIRQFQGAIVYFTQSFHYRIANQPAHSDLTFKFDFFDPNTKVSGTKINTGGGYNTADIAYTTLGGGYTFCPTPYFKLMLWYDHVMNESSGLSGWTSNYTRDDVFTLRTQFMIDTWWFDKKSGNKNLITRSY